jgi:hypothetical protein
VREEDRATYRRGAKLVIPAFLFAVAYFAFRLWLITRQPQVEIHIDVDAIAVDLQRMADDCGDAGWPDSAPCSMLLNVSEPNRDH